MGAKIVFFTTIILEKIKENKNFGFYLEWVLIFIFLSFLLGVFI